MSVEKIIILGSGVSGRAAEALLEEEGYQTRCVDQASMDDASYHQLLAEEPIAQAIISPGFSIDHPWVQALAAQRIPFLSELELGWSRFTGKTIALTGSNGKSTAVKWICEILQAQGYQAHIAGNYGIPLSEQVRAFPRADWMVVEVSSFQLESVRQFSPDVGVLLNLYPNLNRHGSMEVYALMKSRVFGSLYAPTEVILPQVKRAIRHAHRA